MSTSSLVDVSLMSVKLQRFMAVGDSYWIFMRWLKAWLQEKQLTSMRVRSLDESCELNLSMAMGESSYDNFVLSSEESLTHVVVAGFLNI